MKPNMKIYRVFNLLPILMLVVTLIGLLTPGLVSATNSAYLGGESSILNRQGSLSVNKLNGQAFFNITLVAISCKSGLSASADLSYSSLNIHRKVDVPNEEVNVGCAGLGWNLGTSFIRVYHNNTVNTDDDQWFLCYSSGAMSEIKRFGTSNFVIRAYPDNMVTPHYEGETSIIDGWTIKQSDGSTLKFGDFGGTVNANRFVQCSGDIIGANFVQQTIRDGGQIYI
ncbi:MAG: hypothetical protein JW863_11295 [Chitinispirillaceae bacterium]|nr:hypothetical protein [Chitinispirillaceae bacterium]